MGSRPDGASARRAALSGLVMSYEEDSMHEKLITPGGLARLTDELDRLRTSGRRQVAERIRTAMAADAVPDANPDYLAAREEQAFLEARIAKLEARLAAAEVAEPDPGNDVVDLGERVRLRDLETGKRLEYQLVGTLEANPTVGLVSAASPIGRALIGRRRGEVAVVEAPRGTRQLKILSVTQPGGDRPSASAT
jgi:transcription elongation factor GreA